MHAPRPINRNLCFADGRQHTEIGGLQTLAARQHHFTLFYIVSCLYEVSSRRYSGIHRDLVCSKSFTVFLHDHSVTACRQESSGRNSGTFTAPDFAARQLTHLHLLRDAQKNRQPFGSTCGIRAAHRVAIHHRTRRGWNIFPAEDILS